MVLVLVLSHFLLDDLCVLVVGVVVLTVAVVVLLYFWVGHLAEVVAVMVVEHHEGHTIVSLPLIDLEAD